MSGPSDNKYAAMDVNDGYDCLHCLIIDVIQVRLDEDEYPPKIINMIGLALADFISEIDDPQIRSDLFYLLVNSIGDRMLLNVGKERAEKGLLNFLRAVPGTACND